MSYVQWQEEMAYDTQTEYLAVLRQEHYDPYEYERDPELDAMDSVAPDPEFTVYRPLEDPNATDPWIVDPPF